MDIYSRNYYVGQSDAGSRRPRERTLATVSPIIPQGMTVRSTTIGGIMEKKKSPNKSNLDSMLGSIERKVPAAKPASVTCRNWYCSPM
ncbi:hypothetical protein ACFQ3B_05550 [Stackebrandtia endophytica]|nr:hypothetical protein [Stackebrandtia endophytica]